MNKLTVLVAIIALILVGYLVYAVATKDAGSNNNVQPAPAER